MTASIRVTSDSGQIDGAALRIGSPEVGGVKLGPAGIRVSGPTPFSSAAAATTILKVEPGGNVSASARLRSGRSGSCSSLLYAAVASLVLWLASGLGSKLGMETIACTAPVRGSMAMAAPLSAPRLLLRSWSYATSWARRDRVSSTLPPAVRSPVNMSFTRLAMSWSLVPARKSFSNRSTPVAARLTGL